MNYPSAGYFDDIPCAAVSYLYSRVCRRTVGYTLASNGKYYKALHITQNPINTSSAKALCRAEGAQLASAPYGAEDNQAMAQFRAQLSNLGMSFPTEFFFYVDGTDVVDEKLWVLPDGQLGGPCLNFVRSTHQSYINPNKMNTGRRFNSNLRGSDPGQIWHGVEPSGNTDQNCLVLALNGLLDMPCDWMPLSTMRGKVLCEFSP